jgi:hypothetical protein
VPDIGINASVNYTTGLARTEPLASNRRLRHGIY